jgi:hypothetical protein
VKIAFVLGFWVYIYYMSHSSLDKPAEGNDISAGEVSFPLRLLTAADKPSQSSQSLPVTPHMKTTKPVPHQAIQIVVFTLSPTKI